MRNFSSAFTKGFTIPELLVITTIVSILSTIGFISFVGYTQNARDTVRKADVNSIEEITQLYYVSEQEYPPVSGGFDVVYDGFPLWTQGVFGIETQNATGKIFGDLKDPRYGNQYAYSVTQSKQEYQLGVVYERTTIGRDDWRFTQNLIPESYAQASDNAIVNLPTDNPALFHDGLQAWFDATDVDGDGLDDGSDQFIGNVGIVNDVSQTAFTPFYFDRVIWLDSQDIRGNGVPYTDGADVTTWRNKTGAGFDAFVPQTGNNHSNPSHSSAPEYTANGFNGNPGVKFNGVSRGDRIVVDRGGQPKGEPFSLAYTFSINDTVGTNHATIISVGPTGGGEYFSIPGGWQLSRDGTHNNFVFRINGAIYDRTYFDSDGNIETGNDSNFCIACDNGEIAFGSWNEVNSDTPHTVFLTYEGNIITGYLDGTKRFEAILTSSTQPFGEYFRFFGNRAGTAYLEGILGEVFIAGEKISLQDIERIEGYFAHRWDWIESLPTGHPFKANPPQMDSFSQIDYTRYSGYGSIPDTFDSNDFYATNPDILNIETARYPGSMPGVNIAENNKVHIWRGPIKVSETGDYTFSLSASDYGFIKIDGDTVVNSGASALGVTQSGSIHLVEDVSYDFEMIFGVDENYVPSLAAARNITNGYHNFDIDGEIFSSYIEGGWVLVASGRGVTDSGEYASTRNLTFQSDSILSSDIVSSLTETDEIRINQPGNPNFDVTTNNATIISRLVDDYRTLSYQIDGLGNVWSGSGTSFVNNNSCDGNNETLSREIYHGCGNQDGLHWQPRSNREERDFEAGDVDLNLWVRADAVQEEVFGNLEYRVDGPGVVGYRNYTAFGWEDKSSNANNLSQIVPELQPSFSVGDRSFVFQEDDYFDFTEDPIGSTDDIEMFVVWEAEDTGSVEDLDGYIFENTIGSPGSLQFGAGGMRAGSNEVFNPSIIGKQTQLSSYKVGQGASGTIQYFLGAQNYAVNETDVTGYDTPFYIGDKNGGLNGRVKEILIYNNHLDVNEREQIEGYLSHKWGIQNKLPGIHPYYAALDSDDESFVEITGNYNGMFVHSSLGDSHIVVVSPSIMSSLSSSTTLDIRTVMGENRLVYNGYLNSPASYVGLSDSSEKIVDKNGFFFDVSEPRIFEGTRHELANFDGISEIDESVRLIYTNSRIYEDLSQYLEDQNTDYVKDILGNVIGINPITPFYCKDILDKSFGSNISFVANILGSSGESVSGGLETINDGDTGVDESYSYRTNPGEDPEITLEWEDIYDIGFIRVYNGFGDISQNLWSATMSVFDESDTKTYEYTFGNTLGVGIIDIHIPAAVSDRGVQKIIITPVSDYDSIALREIEVFIGQNLQSGIYKVDSDGIGGQASYNVFCDMETDGGGWTKVGENFIDRGNFQGNTDPSNFAGYFVSGNINNVSENTIISNITPPGDLVNAGVLRHTGDSDSFYELNFLDLPDIEFTSEIRLGAWVKGTSESPFAYGLTYEGALEQNFHANSNVLDPNIWRYETLRVPLTDTLEAFTWKIGRGIDASATPLEITGLSVELYYK